MINEKQTLGRYVSCRIKASDHELFIKKASEIGMDQSTIIREFVEAFISGRMKITPTKEQRKLITKRGGLYNVTGK